MRFLPAFLALVAVTLIVSGCTIEYYDDPNAYQDDYDDEYYYEDDYYGDTDAVFAEFDDLKFWGQWVELYPYGWVWAPTVVLGWRPYDNGHWIWSEYGWTWVSYEPFGWATYHYGFWAYDVVWGWVWIPDYEWSPARVEFICYDNYIAWAPLPPSGFRIGEPWIVKEVYVWHVVPASDFTRPDIGRYHVGYKDNYRVRGRSTVKYKAPQVDYVERTTNTAVRPVKISLRDRATRNDVVIKQVDYPDTEVRRIERYRNRVEKKIRDDDPPDRRQPVDDDRIIAPREQRTRDAERQRDEPRKREPRKEPEKETRDDDKPRKQEPDREPQKREPQKKEPEKKQPQKEQPKKKGDSGKDRGERQPKKKRG